MLEDTQAVIARESIIEETQKSSTSPRAGCMLRGGRLVAAQSPESRNPATHLRRLLRMTPTPIGIIPKSSVTSRERGAEVAARIDGEFSTSLHDFAGLRLVTSVLRPQDEEERLAGRLLHGQAFPNGARLPGTAP